MHQIDQFHHFPLAYTFTQFCRTHGVSRSLLYQLLARGEGPDVMRVGRRVLISTEAAARWRERMAKNAGDS